MSDTIQGLMWLIARDWELPKNYQMVVMPQEDDDPNDHVVVRWPEWRTFMELVVAIDPVRRCCDDTEANAKRRVRSELHQYIMTCPEAYAIVKEFGIDNVAVIDVFGNLHLYGILESDEKTA